MAIAYPAQYGARINGTLIAATFIATVNNLKPISTVVFNSSTSPTIQFSLDGGTTYYPAVTPTGTETGQIYYVLSFPVTNIKFTGAIGDTWSIL